VEAHYLAEIYLDRYLRGVIADNLENKKSSKNISVVIHGSIEEKMKFNQISNSTLCISLVLSRYVQCKF
jgi:hypothetical protein